MTINNLKLKITNNNLYYIMLFFIVFHQSLSDSSIFIFYENIKQYFILLIIFMFLVQLFFLIKKGINYKEIVLLSFTGLSIYTSSIIGQTWITYMLFCMMFLRNKDIDKIIKIIFYTALIPFAVTYLVFLYTYFTDKSSLIQIIQYGQDLRYFMFYNTPNNASRIFVFLCMAFFYMKKGLLNSVNIIIMIATLIITYYFTKSDAIYLVIMMLGLYYLSKNKELNFIPQLYRYIFICALIFVFILYLFPYNYITELINKLFVGRFNLSFQYLNIYGISLLGQNAPLGYTNINGIMYKLLCDNGMIFTIVNYGVIYFIFISIMYLSIITVKLKNYEYICIIIYTLYMLIENRLYDSPSFFPLLIIAYLWLNKRKLKFDNLWKNRVRKVIKNDNTEFKSTNF